MSLPLTALDGRLELKGLLGQGGMGQVHSAWDQALDRAVAVKFVRSADPVEGDRLLLEARLQARVEHPHVVQVHEVGTLGGRPCIVMQLVGGGTLASLPAGVPLDVRLALLRQAALGLHAAHLQGLVHRDVKPGNILVEAGDHGALRALVSDFGLARDEEGGLTRSGLPAGTLDYMAPEVLAGLGPVDFRADLFALGATAYSVLSGRLPFRDTTRSTSGPSSTPSGETSRSGAQLLRRILEEDPAPLPDLPRDLMVILHKAMEKAPGDRYASAEAFAEDLRRHQAGEPILARRVTLADRAVKWTRRNPSAARLSVLGSVLVLLGLGYAAWSSRRAAQETLAASRLGAEAQRLELQLTAEALLPPHDLRTSLDRVRIVLRDLDTRPARVAAGPAAFLRGRALQLLGDQEAALEPLRRAWALGHRLPEVAIALSEAEGVRFALERAEAARAEDPALRAKLIQQAESTWRDPARARLTALPGSDDAPGLVARARLAALEERHEEAMALGWQAATLDPARLDAAVIALRAAEAQAAEEAEAGALAQAKTRLLAAVTRGEAALAVGRSSLTLRVALVGLHLRLAAVEAGRQRAGSLAAAQARIDEALALDVDSPLALEAAVAVAAEQAKAFLAAGGDPLPLLGQELQRARRAVAVAPRSAEAHLRLAQVLQRRGQLPNPGGNPDLTYTDPAIAEARAAQQLAPGWTEPFRLEAQARLRRAWWQQERGGDGAEDVTAAVAIARRLVEGGRLPITGRFLLAQALQGQARQLQRSGGDPFPEFRAAWNTLQEVARLAPGHPELGPAVSDLCTDWGDQALADGVDEDAAFGEAEALVRAWLATHPENQVEQVMLVNLLAYRALLPGFSGAPKEAPLREALARLGGLKLPPLAAEMDRSLAEVKLQWARRTGRPADADEAERAARRALQRYPATTRTWHHLAGALLLQAGRLQGTARRQILREAAAASERGLAGGWRAPAELALHGLIREALAPGSGLAALTEARQRDPRLVILREGR